MPKLVTLDLQGLLRLYVKKELTKHRPHGNIKKNKTQGTCLMYCTFTSKSIQPNISIENHQCLASAAVIDKIDALCKQEICLQSQTDAVELKKLTVEESQLDATPLEKKWFSYLYRNYKIWLTADDLSIQIGIHYRVDFAKVSKCIQMIAALFEDRILNISYSGPLPLPDPFLKQFGHIIYTLDLRNHREINDVVLDNLITCCPTLESLILNSKSLVGQGLGNISSLNNLRILNLCGAAPLEVFPEKLPCSIEKIILTSCSILKLPVTWPEINKFSASAYSSTIEFDPQIKGKDH